MKQINLTKPHHKWWATLRTIALRRSTCWLTILLILVLYVFCQAGDVDTSNNQSLGVTVLFEADDLMIFVDKAACVELSDSTKATGFFAGFVIGWEKGADLEGKSSILWGHSEYCYVREVLTRDIDGDGPLEVFTLFEDESSYWGFVHRVTLDKTGTPTVQSLRIPELTATLTTEKTGNIMSDVKSSEVKFMAIKSKNGDTLRVQYDVKADSLLLR